MAFLKRLIDVTIQLKEPATFGDGKGDTMTLTGHRVGAYIAQAGGESQGTLQCQIFGLPLEMLNRLTAVNNISPQEYLNNKILIAAGTDGDMHLAFEGTINQAWADLTNQPDVVLNIISTTPGDLAINPAGATSYKGAADVKDMLASIAKDSGLAFENTQNISVTLINAYFPGSTLDKIRAICRAARINFTIEKGTLAIWNRGGARNEDGEMFLLSPNTGMVGYPTYSGAGILVTCIYNSVLRLGDHIQVESEITPASGIWGVNQIIHSLESEQPNGSGAWFTTLYCNRVGQ